MKLPIYQVDAFASQAFSGNPAAICPLEHWLEESVMQAIAAENNLSETAFFVAQGKDYHIRWFTPTVEVDLCGHATLASAYVIFECLDSESDQILFHSKSGPLPLKKEKDRIVMDFPSKPPTPCTPPEILLKAFDQVPLEVWKSDDYLVVFEQEKDIAALQPDMAALAQLDLRGVMVTAKGDSVDWVSRFFAPKYGIPEDPVTGSAHCTLTPYWTQKLGKTTHHALQISSRGGELFCELKEDRVMISGKATLFLEGTITF